MREGVVALGFIGCDFANKCFIITSLLLLAAKKRRRAAREGRLPPCAPAFPLDMHFLFPRLLSFRPLVSVRGFRVYIYSYSSLKVVF